jgi:hypothetical protein
MPRYQWIEKSPLYWTILFAITMAQIAVSLALFFTLPRWAQSTPDASHLVELRMKGGHLYYLSPGIGWFMNNDLWITFGLLGVLALIMVIQRDKIERIQ